MALQVTGLNRVFRLKKGGETITLPDPNPAFAAAEVIQFYGGQYPELTNCTIDGPTIDNDQAVYEFKTTIGTKG